MEKALVIGIGNVGRADDGLGWAFADRLLEDDQFEVVHRYQLQVEDAELISGYDRVWFVDASHEKYDQGFECKTLKPEPQLSYTSHELHPAAVLNLCKDLYQRTPNAQLLGISGEDWELGHKMSRAACERLQKALAYFLTKWDHGQTQDYNTHPVSLVQDHTNESCLKALSHSRIIAPP